MKFTCFAAIVSLIIFTTSCARTEHNEVVDQAYTSNKVSEVNEFEKSVQTISQSNSDLASIENIIRPAKSEIINSALPFEKLSGTWTYDPNGPHADFVLDEDWFYVVDYDGNGNMPIIINKDSITVFYNDYLAKGRIEKATGDSLFIAWDGQPAVIRVRWKN